jgi:cytochrome c peroxidase
MKNKIIIFFVAFIAILIACQKDNDIVSPVPKLEVDSPATPYNLVTPAGFPPIKIPTINPLTVEGIALGRKLFYDPILSLDNTQSCASCHRQNYAFTDSNTTYSKGITGAIGFRNAMPIMNLVWEKKFFWDGGSATLEDQVIAPILNPIEMHETLPNVLNKLRNHPEYPKLFKKAFGTDSITTMLLMKAVAQFERTIISANSKYDKYVRGELDLSADELAGKELFIDQEKGDCNHCHILGSTFTDFDFKNNGLDSVFKDLGRYNITLKDSDKGKFKTPTLRNIELTAPYMHDGRFTTLEQVIEHYNSDFIITPTTDVNIALLDKLRGRLTATEKLQIIAFLKTLTDYDFITNPNFKKP